MAVKLFKNYAYDCLVVTSETMSSDDINNSKAINYIPNWDSFINTETMCGYTDTINSAYISGLTSEVTGYTIYRQNSGDSYLHKVASVGVDQFFVVDYTIANNASYTWSVVPLTATEQGSILQSEEYTTDWYRWSVSPLVKVSDNFYTADTTWTFSLNLSPDDVKHNIDKTLIENYTKYPKFTVGNSNYVSGGLSTLLGNVSCSTFEYDDSADKWNAWKDFVASGQDCLLKDTKGNAWRVQIDGNQYSELIKNTTTPLTIRFTFTEVGSMDGISVYGTSE